MRLVSVFACHSTAAINGLELQLDRMIPASLVKPAMDQGGYIVAMEAKRFNEKHIFNPRKTWKATSCSGILRLCHQSAEKSSPTTNRRSD